jgi:hypothetical protein
LVSVDQLRRDFDARYKNELVAVRGWVDTERRVPSRTFKGYYLKDRYGSLILVRTTRPLPEITAEIAVKGVALRDADSGDVFLSETNREQVAGPAGASGSRQEPSEAEAALRRKADEAQRRADEALRKSSEAERRADEARRQTEETRRQSLEAEARAERERRRLEEEQQRTVAAARRRQNLMLALIGVGAVALLAGLVLVLRRPSSRGGGAGEPATAWTAASPPVSSPANLPAAGPVMSDAALQEFKTVKVYKTTKVWPGRLMVVEKGQETDVIPLSDQSGRGEIEIGRDSPDMADGIRIKDPSNTLSRHQARITYSPTSSQFTLVNLAGEGSNPTSINGRQMREKESVVLKDGDALVMGSVEMRFRGR